MNSNIISSIRLTLVCLLFFVGFYTFFVWGLAQFAPNNGKGETVLQNGLSYYVNIGQSFTADKYFYSRPSAVGYNAAGAGGSNLGPTNPKYLALVQARIDAFLAHNPGVSKSEIPSDLLTASGSGLDANISVQAAKVQVNRIAEIRNISKTTLLQLIEQQTEKPFLGLFGTEKINVLKLNLALDLLKQQQ